jgi:hypothetical protein
MRIINELPIGAMRPGWLTSGATKFLILCAAIAGIAMLSPTIGSQGEAGAVALLGILATLVGAATLTIASRRLARRASKDHTDWSPGQLAAGAFLGLIRGTGLPLLGLAFFLVWTFVYLSMYWANRAAFAGISATPRYADFFYYSVSTGLISPPGDIIASTRGARSATVIEMLAGLALVTTYLSSFANFGGRGSIAEDVNDAS